MSDRFVADVESWIPKLDGRINRFYQNIVAECADQGVVTPGRWGPGTPVDTGFARRSWRFGISAPTDGPVKPNDGPKSMLGTESHGTDTGGAMDLSGIVKLTFLQPCYLTTNCEYMPSLEFGHSKQAPAGMVRTVLAQAQQIADFVASSMLRVA